MRFFFFQNLSCSRQESFCSRLLKGVWRISNLLVHLFCTEERLSKGWDKNSNKRKNELCKLNVRDVFADNSNDIIARAFNIHMYHNCRHWDICIWYSFEQLVAYTFLYVLHFLWLSLFFLEWLYKIVLFWSFIQEKACNLLKLPLSFCYDI